MCLCKIKINVFAMMYLQQELLSRRKDIDSGSSEKKLCALKLLKLKQ